MRKQFFESFADVANFWRGVGHRHSARLAGRKLLSSLHALVESHPLRPARRKVRFLPGRKCRGHQMAAFMACLDILPSLSFGTVLAIT